MSDHAHGTTTIEHSGLKQPYHLVDPSPWPIIGAVGGALVVLLNTKRPLETVVPPV